MRTAILFFALFSSIVFANKPQILVFDTKEELGQAVACKMANLIKANNERGSKTVLGLATGTTPIHTYQAFKQITLSQNLDLSCLITFNLDEYVGLPLTHPQSYHSFMKENLFSAILFSTDNPRGILTENIHIPNGMAKNESDLTEIELIALHHQFPKEKREPQLTQEEERWIVERRAMEYEALIKMKGPIDLQILGIGTNGHIGFCEPGTSFSSRTMIVALSDNTKKDNARFFGNDPKLVPAHAMTMGIETILQAKEILLLATGKNKALIIKETIESPPSPSLPATALQKHPNVTFYLDKEAASLLQK